MPLLLDLVRHGEAEPPGATRDPGRLLTPAGEASMRALAARIAAAGSLPARVFSSPLVRARRSAQLIANELDPALTLEVLEALDPDAPSAGVIGALAALDLVDGHVLLVGHLPQIDDLHMLLTGKSAAFPVATLHRIVFVGGAVAWAGRAVLTLRP